MHGKWEGWFENGTKDYSGTYNQGLKDGIWDHFYDNGQQELMDWYEAKNVPDTNYYREESGKYATFIKEKLVSVQEGPHQLWYKNGNLKEDGKYEDNMQSGEWTYYYEDGKKQYQQTLIKGKQEGKVTSWYGIGTLESEKYFKKGRANGKWTYYTKKAGEIKQEMYFKNGVKVNK